MRLSINQTAKIMQLDKQFLRLALQRNLLPIGIAVKTSSVYTYYIDSKKVADYLGRSESEVLSQL